LTERPFSVPPLPFLTPQAQMVLADGGVAGVRSLVSRVSTRVPCEEPRNADPGILQMELTIGSNQKAPRLQG